MSDLLRVVISIYLITALFYSVKSQSFSINNDGSTAHASAILDVKSTVKGLLIPRMTSAQRLAISGPSEGLLVYQTDAPAGFYFYKTGIWTILNAEPNWSLNGNTGTVDGTNFIGTTDNIPLNIRVNNQKSGRIDPSLANAFYGYKSGNSISTGFANTAIGTAALQNNTIGSNNTAIGDSALLGNITGYSNTAMGRSSLEKNTTGFYNTAVGRTALFSNTTGSNNTALGLESLYSNTTGSGNTAIGYFSLKFNSTGQSNTSTGGRSLENNTTGYDNTANGLQTLYSNTTGYGNTAIGVNSLFYNINGNENLAVGNFALFNNSSGSNNTAIGRESLFTNSTNNKNTALGYRTLYLNTGLENTASGYQSLQNNASGYWNTAIGSESLGSNTTGQDNIAVGYHAGLSSYPTSSLNSYLGSSSSSNTGIQVINSSAVGFGTNVSASNQIRIGQFDITSIGGFVGWTTLPSDARFKDNVQENVPGIAFIRLLKPVTYHLKLDEIEDQIYRITGGTKTQLAPDLKEKMRLAREEKREIIYTGFIAQDVVAAAKTIGYDFSGVDVPKSGDDVYGIRYGEFVVPLVKAVQEQQQLIDKLNQKLEELKKQVVHLTRGNK